MAFTNYDMYEVTLDFLRKDKKGAINIEEFENRLKFWSVWLFKQLLPTDGRDKRMVEALTPFKVVSETGTATSNVITPDIDGDNLMAHFISGSYGTSPSFYPIDLVTVEEYRDRVTNAITKPSATDPVGFLSVDTDGEMVLNVYSLAAGTYYIDYYKYPTEPYLDYYIDSSGNYNYLTEDQAEYTLGSGEVARNGSTTTVDSATAEIEWFDAEKVMLIEYILSEVGVAIKDQGIVQQAMMERQTSLIK